MFSRNIRIFRWTPLIGLCNIFEGTQPRMTNILRTEAAVGDMLLWRNGLEMAPGPAHCLEN